MLQNNSSSSRSTIASRNTTLDAFVQTKIENAEPSAKTFLDLPESWQARHALDFLKQKLSKQGQFIEDLQTELVAWAKLKQDAEMDASVHVGNLPAKVRSLENALQLYFAGKTNAVCHV